MASLDVCLDCSRTVHNTGYIRRGQDILYATCVGDCYLMQRLQKKSIECTFIPLAADANEHVS